MGTINLEKYLEKRELDNGLIRAQRKPHTKPVESLTSCCAGPDSTNYYFLCRYFGMDFDGELMLSEIKKLQNIDTTSERYGCLRWYREEPFISDTNGAFFILKPLCLALLMCEKAIPEKEKEIILDILKVASVWFVRECKEPELYYSNKTVSDGALLLLIGKLLKDKKLIDTALKFWTNWLDYTKNRGWGWGENMSRGYSVVIIDGLNIALSCLDKKDPYYIELFNIRKQMLDYRAYHGAYEYVPTIRTYNFTGIAKNEASFDFLNPTEKQFASGSHANFVSYILYNNTEKYIPELDTSKTHKERIFEDSVAYTYKGENIRLGTITHFPVMQGCYQGRGEPKWGQVIPKCHQNAGWGLGWQTMPVSILANKHEMSFLRFASIANNEMLTHIAYDHHFAYLNPLLFKDGNMPLINTYSNQSENMAVVVRDIRKVANTFSYLADEWYLPRFSGEASKYKNWFVFSYNDCMYAITSPTSELILRKDGENMRLSQVCYDGEEKFSAIQEWIATWCVVALDDTSDWQKKLDETEVKFEERSSLDIPRIYNPFTISCGGAKLDFDIATAKVY